MKPWYSNTQNHTLKTCLAFLMIHQKLKPKGTKMFKNFTKLLREKCLKIN